jgi:hypothetical protein
MALFVLLTDPDAWLAADPSAKSILLNGSG